MKLLFENWRKFISEANENFPYQIYCDMDGVLVDFEAGAVQRINRDIEDENVPLLNSPSMNPMSINF